MRTISKLMGTLSQSQSNRPTMITRALRLRRRPLTDSTSAGCFAPASRYYRLFSLFIPLLFLMGNVWGQTISSPVITSSGGIISNGTVKVHFTFAQPVFPAYQNPNNPARINSGYQNVVLKPISALTSITEVSCNGGNNASATVGAGYGFPPYHYLWSNGQTNASISGLQAGQYQVTITDANVSKLFKSLTITEPAAITFTINGSNTTCGQSNGNANIILESGGVAPFHYYWNNTQTSASISGLQAGQYQVTVTDAHTCTANFTTTISTSIANSVTITNDNGELYANTSSTPASFIWSNGSTTASINVVQTGTFSVTVTDILGCTASASFDAILGIENINSPLLKIYPNPTSGIATINLMIPNNEEITNLMVYNSIGQLVNVDLSLIEKNKYQLDFTHLDKAIYIIRLQSKTQSITRSILVEK
jgi:hypothetical protein